MASSPKTAQFLIESRLADAAHGDVQACLDLGTVYSSGAQGIGIDLIEAHKWFNLAALRGDMRAQECRAEISGEMTRGDIIEAQRQARAWLQVASQRHAA